MMDQQFGIHRQADRHAMQHVPRLQMAVHRVEGQALGVGEMALDVEQPVFPFEAMHLQAALVQGRAWRGNGKGHGGQASGMMRCGKNSAIWHTHPWPVSSAWPPCAQRPAEKPA
jgi:hypothetical protein